HRRQQRGVADVLRPLPLLDGARAVVLRDAGRRDARGDVDAARAGDQAAGNRDRLVGGAARGGVCDGGAAPPRDAADGGLRIAGAAVDLDCLPDRAPDGNRPGNLGARALRAQLLDCLRPPPIRPASDRARRHRSGGERPHARTHRAYRATRSATERSAGDVRRPRIVSIAFLVTTIVVVVSPGPGVLYTVGAGLHRGRRASVVAAFGCTLGIVPHVVAATVGLAALLYAS